MSTRAPSADASVRLLEPCELAAWRGFLRAHTRLVRELDAELEAEHGMPLTSYEVLLYLADSPGGRMRMSELAEAVLLSRSGLTRLVDRLERDGLLERSTCPSDARGLFAVMTDRGRRAFAAARITHLEGVRRSFTTQFSPGELKQMAAFWDRLTADPPGAAGDAC